MFRESLFYRTHMILSALLTSVLLCGPVGATAPVTGIPHDGETVTLRSWLLTGMFPSKSLIERESDGASRGGYNTDYLTELGGEAAARPVEGTQVTLPDGSTTTFERRDWEDDYLNLMPIFGADGIRGEVLAYLYTELENPVEQDVYFHVGTNDGGKVWVNGEPIVAHPFDRAAHKSQNVGKAHLPAGRIPVLIKSDQAGGSWGVYVDVFGKSTHERILAGAGPGARRRAAEQLAALREEFGDPLQLTGSLRDAYAAALYAYEQVDMAVPQEGEESEWHRGLLRVEPDMQSLSEAVTAAREGRSPHEGRVGTFEPAYLSNADGTAQPMTISIPESFDPDRKYDLLLELHGAGRTHEQPDDWWHGFSEADSAYHESTIAVAVMGRGQWAGYRGLAEDDVLQVIDWVSSRYPINPDRVYIAGSSMGGGGTWRIASRYPDRFAAAWPECGWPDRIGMPNLVNLPMYIHHGGIDWVVAKTFDGIAAADLSALGYPVYYTEWNGVGHAVVQRARADGWMDLLSAHTRSKDPIHVRIRADHPRNASIDWAEIARWIDPHAVAKLDARVVSPNTITVSLENVSKAVLTPPASRLTADGDLVWLVNGHRVVAPRSADGAYDLSRRDVPAAAVGADSSWAVSAHIDEPAPTRRPYAPGSTMNLYRGEPLLIVYGTSSPDENLNEAIREMADEASRWSSATSDHMLFGRVPVKADHEVTDDDLATKNVYLIGGPAANTVTNRLMADLPVREENGELIVFGVERVPLEGRGYCAVYPNPRFPRRLVAIYSSEVEQFYTIRRSRLASWYVGDWDPFLPDVLVEEVAQVDSAEDIRWNSIVRGYRFTHDWQVVDSPEDMPTRHPESVRNEADYIARAMLEATEADFSFMHVWDNPESPINYVPGVTRWSDLDYRRGRVVTFDVTGSELLRFASHEETEFPWVTPEVDLHAVDQDATYRIAANEGAVWSMTRMFQWNPTNAEFFEDTVVLERCLRREWGVE